MTPKTRKRKYYQFARTHHRSQKRCGEYKEQPFKTYEAQRIHDLGGKIDKIYWVLLAMVGTIALQLFQTLSEHNLCNYQKILA